MDTQRSNTVDKRYQYTVTATFLIGFLSHGLMLTNKISYHDDIGCLFGVGDTMSLGRWGLELLYRVISCIAEKFSMPVWTGFVCFTFISISACMIIDMLEIKEITHCVLVGALMTVFPAVTIVFLYMFTAGCYFFALFLNVLAIWLMEKYHNIGSAAGAVICIAFALGIYQAYYSVSISLMLFVLIKSILQKEDHVFIKTGRFLSVELAGLILYFIILKISLAMMGISLSSYQGIESITKLSIRDRIERVFKCYYIIKQDIFQDNMGICGGGLEVYY